MLKRILIMLISMALVCPTVFAEDYEDNYFEAAEYYEVASFLQSLGIIDETDEYLETDEWTLTRGEFVHLAVSAMNFADLAASMNEKCPFADVSLDYKYIKDITFAASINLFGENLGFIFKPDEPVTREFAATVGVCMVGRSFMLSSVGSYVNAAQQAKLFENVNFYDGDKLSRGETLVFIENVLNTDIASVSFLSGAGDYDFSIQEGKSLINSCFGLELCKGVVTSDGVTTVFGEQAQAGCISVDNVQYRALCTDYFGLAGQYIKFYVKTPKNGKPQIQSIEAVDNRILTLGPDTINGFDPSTRSYSALVDGKTRKLTLDSRAFVAYNYEPDYDPALMCPAAGAVKLIDHNGDGIYDAVLVYEFRNTIVKYYSGYSEIIYDSQDSAYDINLKGYDSYTVVDLKNNPLELEKISKDNVVSLYENPTEKTARLVVSANTERGVLQAYNRSEHTLKISDAAYRISQAVRFSDNSVSVGGSYQVFFDSMGEIAYLKGNGGTVAYLVSGKKEGTFETTVTLRLLDEDTKGVRDIELAKKVKVVRPNIADASLNAETLYDTVICSGGSFSRQMVMFKTNGKGQINKLIFPMEIDDYDKLFTAESYPLYYLSYMVKQFPEFAGGVYNSGGALNEEESKFTYYASGDSANRWLLLGSNTLGFYVPNTTNLDYESLAVKSITFADKETIRLDEMRFYTDDLDSITAPYIVVQKAAQDRGYEDMYPSMISSICMVYDDSIGETYQLTVNSCYGGEQSVLTLKDSKYFFAENFINKDAVAAAVDNAGNPVNKTQLEVGDMITYNRDAEGRITGIYLTWINNVNTEFERYGILVDGVASTNSVSRAIYPGIIKRISDDIVELTVDGATGTASTERLQRIRWGKSSNLLDMSGRGEAVFTKTPSVSELVPGDRIFILGETGARTYGTWVYRK